MKKIKYIIFIFVLLIYANCFAFEKVGTTSFQFLKVISNARGTGMGEAYSSVASGSESVFYNPAGLTMVNSIDFSADYLDWFLDITHFSFSAAYRYGDLGTFGIHGIMTDVGTIKETTVESLDFVDGVYLGYTGRTYEPGAMVLGLSYALTLTDKFSFGLTAKYAREDLGVRVTDNIMFDIGLLYSTGYKSLKIAATIRHFGPDVKYYDDIRLARYNAVNDSTYYQKYTGKAFPLPQTFAIGISGYVLAPENSLLLESSDNTVLIAFDMVQPRDYDQQYNLGLEYGFDDLLFLRGGYKINYDQEGLSLGFGVNYLNYRIDYAFSDFGDYLDSVHRFSFGFRID